MYIQEAARETGEAAGTACALACQAGCDVGDVDVNALQQALARRGAIIGTGMPPPAH